MLHVAGLFSCELFSVKHCFESGGWVKEALPKRIDAADTGALDLWIILSEEYHPLMD
jgi:hypothetical protein